MKILSMILLLGSAYLSLKHSWDAFRPLKPEMAGIMANLGISNAVMPYFGVFSITIGLMLFFPAGARKISLAGSRVPAWTTEAKHYHKQLNRLQN